MRMKLKWWKKEWMTTDFFFNLQDWCAAPLIFPVKWQWSLTFISASSNSSSVRDNHHLSGILNFFSALLPSFSSLFVPLKKVFF